MRTNWLVLIGILLFMASCSERRQPTRFAKGDTYTIEKALIMYWKDHDHNYPPSLEALTVGDERGGPYLKSEDIIDPWGKQYQFDGTAKKSGKSDRPDVWTISPGGKLIGNWRSSTE